MKNIRNILILILLATLTSQQSKEFRESVELQVNTNGNQFSYKVPRGEIPNIAEYGFAFWMKPSYQFPSYFKFNTFINKDLGIAGIHENTAGFCAEKGWARNLGLFLQRGKWSNLPTLLASGYNIAKGEQDPFEQPIEYPSRDDFDMHWTFVYAGYSYTESKQYVYTYFSHSNTYGSVQWMNIEKRQPAPQINFRLGGCNPTQRQTMQAVFSQVSFFYGPEGSRLFMGEQYSVAQFRENYGNLPWANEPLEVTAVVPVIEDETPTVGSSDTHIRQTVFQHLNGPEEYAVWGWAKWIEPAKRQRAHTLFRLTSDFPGEFQDDDKIGDRTLACFIENGAIGFSTYTFHFSGMQVEPNFYQTEWFFVYFGVSQHTNEAYAYVRFQGGEAEMNWGNVYHMKADQLVLQLGKDEFHPGFNGELKDWNFGYGPGTYRTGEHLQQLWSKTTFEIIVEEAQESEWKLEETSPATHLESGLLASAPIMEYQVPQEDLSSVADISFSFWIKWNFQYPDYATIDVLKSNPISIAHVSETGRTGTNFGDRALSMWLRPLAFGQKKYQLSTYANNKGKPNWGQDIRVSNDEDFDSAWTFVYFAHNAETSDAFGYIRFASETVETKYWQEAIHFMPPEALFFRVGKTENNQFSFNGFFFNVQFQYTGRSYLGSRELVDEYYFNRVTKPDLGIPQFHQETILQGEAKYENNGVGDEAIYDTYDGAGSREYAAWGWAKYVNDGKSAVGSVIFRLSTNQEDRLGDASKPGDRTLMYSIGDGVIIPSTYSYAFSGNQDLNNVHQGIAYEDDLESWFWVYFGYNFNLKRAYTFVRFFDRVEEFQYDGIVHQIPQRFRFTLGNDRFLQSFSGELNEWSFAYGTGAYREINFNELYGSYQPENQPELPVDNFWTEEATLMTSNYEQDTQYEVEVGREELATVTQYSFSYWFRFSFNDPLKVSVSMVRQDFTAMAGITEKNNYYENELGSRALAMYLKPLGRSTQPTLYFSTYATNREQADDYKYMSMTMDELDSNWNWVYFGYDLDLQKAYAGVFFSSTGSTKNLQWDQTVHYHPTSLKFQLGRAPGDASLGFNGKFFDVRFRYDNLAYKENNNLATYYVMSVQSPPLNPPPFARVQLTDGNVVFKTDTDITQWDFPEEFRGATEYSIYGWARWTEVDQRESIHSLFRLTSNSPVNAGNADSAGDRNLACYVTETQLLFSTYTFEEQGGDNWNLSKGIDFGEDLTSWFFVYFGYDKSLKRAKAWVKFANRIEEVIFNEVYHATPKYFGAFVGRDRFYTGFSGEIKNWVFSVGAGAFQESEYASLYEETIDLSDNALYESETNVIQDADHIISILYEDEVPQDQLQNFKVITSWTWFQWGFNIPAYFGNPQTANGNCYHIARMIYGSNQGLFADLCFTDRGRPLVKLEESSLNDSEIKLSELPSLDDLDSSWNFLYMSHNEELKTTIAYVYYSNAQQRFVFQFDERSWGAQPQYARFKLGGGAVNGRLLFNGRFYDAQMSTFEAYYKTTTSDIEIVQSKVTLIPPKFSDDGLDTQSRRISFTLNEDGLVTTVKDTTQPVLRQITDYKQLKKYAVFGWVQWQGSKDIGEDRLVYRLNQHVPGQAGDASQPGDRTLGLWLTKTGKFVFATYTYDAENTDNNLKYESEIDVRTKITKWFFVYHAYSYEQQMSYLYVRFADGTDFEHLFNNVRHIQTDYYGLYLGRDWLYAPWKGQFYAFSFQVGGLTFVQTAIEAQLFREQAKTSIIINTNYNEQEFDGEAEGVERQQSTLVYETHDSGYDKSEEEKRVKDDSFVTQWEKKVYGWVTTNKTEKAEIQGDYLINKWEGHSYFMDVSNTNMEYKITITSGVPEGSKICFGYVPAEMVDSVREMESKHERYNQHSMSLCSDNEVNECVDGRGICTGGSFDSRAGASYLWKLREDIAFVKQVVVEGNDNCEYLGDLESNEVQPSYFADNGCKYEDTLHRYFWKQNQRSIVHPYQCEFSRKVLCLKNHEFEVDWVPYIELTGNITIQLNKDEYGGYDIVDPAENNCLNVTNSTTENLWCPPPPPPDCEDMFIRDRLNDTYFVNHDGEWADHSSILTINKPGNYWSYNENANLIVTLDGNYPQGEVCLGYIEKKRIDQYIDTGNQNLIDESISICTNGLKFNAGSSVTQIECAPNGKMYNNASTSFNLTVQFNFVQITEVANRFFQCNFTRDEFKEPVFPFLKLHEGASVHVELTGIGRITDLDCGYDYIPLPPSPIVRLCTPEFMFNENDVTQTWFKASSGQIVEQNAFTSVNNEQLISVDNQNANYVFTIESELSGDSFICFGYQPHNAFNTNDVTADEELETSISICTDLHKKNFYSLEPQDIICKGVMNRTAGQEFNVTVLWNKVQFTSMDQHFQCTLWYDNSDVELVPWVYISGQASVNVHNRGVGKIDGHNCSQEWVLKNRTCEVFFDTSYLNDSAWWGPDDEPSLGVFEEPLQFVSANNHDANYEITIENDGTDFCFGYILEQDAKAAEQQTLDFANTFAVCLDGQTSGNGNCSGQINNLAQSRFNLTVQPDWVQITSFDRFFQCNISTPLEKHVVPWSHLKQGEASASLTGVGKVLCYYYPYYKRTCDPDFFDDHQLANKIWNNKNTNEEIVGGQLTNEVVENYQQFTSVQNVNANYNITLDSDSYQGHEICFGYVPLALLKDFSTPKSSFQKNSVSVCTNQEINNVDNTINENTCYQKKEMNVKAGSEFQVTVMKNYVQITSADQYFQCNLTRSTLEFDELVPWIQVKGAQTVQANLWAIGALDCGIPPIQKIYPPIPDRSCQQDMFNESQLTTRDWKYTLDPTDVQTETLSNNGSQGTFKHYVHTDNENANYVLTFNEDYQQHGQICFGFVSKENALEVGKEPFQNKAISLCTNNDKFNVGQDQSTQVHCQGEFHVSRGNQLNITVLWMKVQVTSIPDRYFQCNFTRNSSSEILYPWVQLQSVAETTSSVNVQLKGKGKIENSGRPQDCGYGNFEPPVEIIERTCETDFFDLSQVTSTKWTDGTNEHENVLVAKPGSTTFISQDNTFANYKITFNNDIAAEGDKVCFGMIPYSGINKALGGSNPSQGYSQGLCTNGQELVWSENENNLCQGLHNLNSYTTDQSFNVFVNTDKIQITSGDSRIQCQFYRVDPTVRLFPWVYTHSVAGGETFKVEFLGIGNLDGDSCSLPYKPFFPPPDIIIPPEAPPTPCSRALLDNSSYYTDNSWSSGQLEVVDSISVDSQIEQRREFVAPNSHNRSYITVLKTQFYATTRNLCFGYIPASKAGLSQSGLNMKKQSISFCLNGEINNYLDLPSECTLHPKILQNNKKKDRTFRIDRLWDRVQIYSLPKESTSFICNFSTVALPQRGQPAQKIEEMVPWIAVDQVVTGVASVQVIWKGIGGLIDIQNVCPVSVRPFTPKQCRPDFYDAALINDQGNFYSSGDKATGQLTASSDKLQWTSWNNPDTNFNISLAKGQGKVCFGYVTGEALQQALNNQEFSLTTSVQALCVDSDMQYSTINYGQAGNSANTVIRGANTFSLTRPVRGQRGEVLEDETQGDVPHLFNPHSFYVYLNENKVQITQGDYAFQIDMHREDNSLDLFPWVAFTESGQTAEVFPSGQGKINGNTEACLLDCNLEYIPLLCTDCLDADGNCIECPPPVLHECHNSFWNESLVTQTWTHKNSNTEISGDPIDMEGTYDNEFETFYSPQNVNGNYEIFMDNNFVGGSICFGYILSKDESELVTSEKSFHKNTISVCTNSQAYNKFNKTTDNVFDLNCPGRMPTNKENHFKVLAGFDTVQITAYSQKEFQCNFTMPKGFDAQTHGLTPWIQIQRSSSLLNKVHVRFIGSGRPIDLQTDCQSGFRPIPFSCANQFNNPELVNQQWYKSIDREEIENVISTPGQFLSEFNQNGNFNITLESKTVGKTCFGYIPKKRTNEFYEADEKDFDFLNSISVCTDGTQNNVEGEHSCEGNMLEPGDVKYMVTVLANSVQITADNHHFICNLMRNRENRNLLPWVYSTDDSVKRLELFGLGKPDINEDVPPCLQRYELPIVPVPRRCETHFFNKSLTVDSWERVEDKTEFAGKLPGSGQFISVNNTEGNYNITFDIDAYKGDNYLCFGYISLNQVIKLYSDPSITSLNESVSFCTNGRGYNYQDREGEADSCNGNFTNVGSSDYQVTVRRNNIQITSDDSHLQCNLSLTVDNTLIPWVMSSTESEVNIELLGQGRPVENMPACVRGFVPKPIIPPPPPRTCDDFYTYHQKQITDQWISVKDGEVQSGSTLINDDNEGDEYVSYNNDTNYKFQIRYFTGKVCFGYIDAGLPVLESNSISLCFNETHIMQNSMGANPECGGNFSHATGTTFNVTVLYNNVSIISLHRTFQCNFTRIDNSSFMIPYVKFTEAGHIDYDLFSIGKFDCPRWPLFLPPPIPQRCFCNMTGQQNQWKIINPDGSSVMETNTLKNENTGFHSEFYSDYEGNCQASFSVNLTNVTQDKICFGYIEKRHIFEITSNPSEEHSHDAYGVCTDGTSYPVDTAICQGTINATQGELFSISIKEQLIRLSSASVADTWECTFPRDESITYIPWVEVHGEQEVGVEFTGCDSVETRDCRDFFDSTQATNIWYFRDGEEVEIYQNELSSTEQTNFASEVNPNGNYKVIFEKEPETGELCMGYVTPDNWAIIAQDPHGDHKSLTESVCFINGGIQEFGTAPVCQGKVNITENSEFYITVLDTKIQITQLPSRHFQCEFPVPFEQDLLPWVSTSEDNIANVNFTGLGKLYCPERYYNPPPPPPEPVFNCTNRTWVGPGDLVEMSDFVNKGESSQWVQSLGDEDRSFEVFLYNNYTGGRICFGFLPLAQAQEVAYDSQIDVRSSAYGICTNEPKGVEGATCTGSMDNSEGARFLIYAKNGKFTVRQDSERTRQTTFRCDWPKEEEGLPWIEIRGNQDSLRAGMTCTVYDTPTPPSCEERWWVSPVNGYEYSNTALVNPSEEEAQYKQPDQVNENYTVTITHTPEEGKVSCFGYAPKAQLDHYDHANTVSICTDSSVNNAFQQPFECTGELVLNSGTELWVYVAANGSLVTVRQTHNQFRCDFVVEPSKLVPWVSLAPETEISATVECGEFPATPEPVPRTCEKDFFDEEQLADRNWLSAKETSQGSLKNSDGIIQFVSSNNPNGNYDITFVQPVKFDFYNILQALNDQEVVCFGFVPQSEITDVTANEESTNVIAICTDSTYQNYQSDAVNQCRGKIQYTEGTVYHVWVNLERILVTSQDQHFQCDFPTPASDPLYPYVLLVGQQSVEVSLTGLGKLSGPDCTLEYEPLVCPQLWTSRSSGAEISANYETLTNHGEGYSNYLSAHNVNEAFNVYFAHELQDDGENGEVKKLIQDHTGEICFGYISSALHRVIQRAPDAPFSQQAAALCTDGNAFSYLGETQVNCYGSFNPKIGTSFYVTINATEPDFINIGATEYYFNCKFRKEEGDQLIPYVQIKGDHSVMVENTCSQPVRVPTPPPPPPPPTPPEPTCVDVWDNLDMIHNSWYPAFAYQRAFNYENYLVSQRDDFVQFSAHDEQNHNALYKLTINENYNPQERVCFGYVVAANVVLLEKYPYEDLSNSAIALCTDGSVHNAHGEASCTSDEGASSTQFNEGTNFRVVNYKQSVYIWSKLGDLRCKFTKDPQLQVVPWVQLHGKRSVSVELTGKSFLDENVETCEEPPIFECIEPEPKKPHECAVLFSQCNFNGVSFHMCEGHGHQDLPEDQQGAVLSMYLPPGSQVNLGCADDGQINCGAESLNFQKTEPCLDHREVFHKNIKSAEFIQVSKNKMKIPMHVKKQRLTRNRRI